MRKKDDEKQRSIQNAVVHIILEEGFHGASISKIAKAAGVSPATVYIYYENKEAMLRDIYQEYSEAAIQHILHHLSLEMAAEEIIAELIRKYYFFIVENKEIFHFTEQFSSCPALRSSCGFTKGSSQLDQLLTELKRRQILNDFNNDNLHAMLFYPVKSIAVKTNGSEEGVSECLNELIQMIQKALIKNY